MQDDRKSEIGSSTALNETRRRLLRGAALAGGTVAAASSLGLPRITAAQQGELRPRQVPIAGKLDVPSKTSHWYVPASDKTVHWGYFSKGLQAAIEIRPGDYVTVECLTHQASDDYDRMIKGDPGAESVYYWTKDRKNVNRRGAGPLDAPNGAGAGAG